jgi:ribosomal protein S8
MISNQILQSTIDGIKNIARVELSIYDIDGKLLTATFSNAVDYEGFVKNFADSDAENQEARGCQLFKVSDEYPARNGKQQRCVYDRKDGGIPASEPDHGIQRAF